MATAIPKRAQKADQKASESAAKLESMAFKKPRYPARGQNVPSSVNIMPIVNVNVNLNYSNQQDQFSRGKEVSKKFNWQKELASVAAAA